MIVEGPRSVESPSEGAVVDLAASAEAAADRALYYAHHLTYSNRPAEAARHFRRACVHASSARQLRRYLTTLEHHG